MLIFSSLSGRRIFESFLFMKLRNLSAGEFGRIINCGSIMGWLNAPPCNWITISPCHSSNIDTCRAPLPMSISAVQTPVSWLRCHLAWLFSHIFRIISTTYSFRNISTLPILVLDYHKFLNLPNLLGNDGRRVVAEKSCGFRHANLLLTRSVVGV